MTSSLWRKGFKWGPSQAFHEARLLLCFLRCRFGRLLGRRRRTGVAPPGDGGRNGRGQRHGVEDLLSLLDLLASHCGFLDQVDQVSHNQNPEKKEKVYPEPGFELGTRWTLSG